MNNLSRGVRIWAQVYFCFCHNPLVWRTDGHFAHGYTMRCITCSRTAEISRLIETVQPLTRKKHQLRRSALITRPKCTGWQIHYSARDNYYGNRWAFTGLCNLNNFSEVTPWSLS